MSQEISKREGKVAKDGTGNKVYLKPEEVEQLGIKTGDPVDVTVNADGSITIRPAAPPNLYEKFLEKAVGGGVDFGEPIEVGDAHIIPIFAKSDDTPPRDYVTVPEALALGWLRFTDTGGISGIHVTNTGNKGVLVVQGQVFEGGTQPRTIVTNMILAPNDNVVLPAACVHSSRPIVPNAKMTIAGMSPRTVAFGLMTPRSKINQQRVWGDVCCVMGTTVCMPQSFIMANVTLNQSAWKGNNDLTESMHSLNNVVSYVADSVEMAIQRRKPKWENK